LKDYNVIPTDNFKMFEKLKADYSEEKVEIIQNSNYHTQRSHVQKLKNGDFEYPCIYSITEKDGLDLRYSNTNNKGHFGVPKLILKRGATRSILDLEGKYGMTEFACAIVDTPENLIQIQKVLESKIMLDLKIQFLGATTTPYKSFLDGLGHMVKFLKEFRKDFWKDFI